MNEKYEKIRRILAQNIKSRRENLGLSQEKLAEATNLSVQTINTIEGCRMWVSDKTITRLAKALNTDIFQLFVPYQSGKNELTASPAAVLLELRQKVKNEVNNLNLQLDADFNSALKYPIQQQNERELSAHKSRRNKLPPPRRSGS
jgi:transcriptional regulator with XRE-family HTH domain